MHARGEMLREGIVLLPDVYPANWGFFALRMFTVVLITGSVTCHPVLRSSPTINLALSMSMSFDLSTLCRDGGTMCTGMM